MTRIHKSMFATLALLAFAGSAALPVVASAFSQGTVIRVAIGDHLNVRQWPAAHSQAIAVYPSGAPISLTGRCKDITTNLSFRIDAGGSDHANYARMTAPHVWCQVMTGTARLGWARGKFIWPN
jgi:hypothetical protein